MEIFGLEVLELEPSEVLGVLKGRIEDERKTFVVTLNAQMLVRAKEDPVYWKILKSADLRVVDGVGVQMALRLKYGKSVQRYPGVDIMKDLLSLSKIEEWTIYLLGAKEEVVSKLHRILKSSGVNVVGYHNGYFAGDGPVEEIVSLKPDLVFVAMGVPRQEEWIFSNIDKFEKGIFIGVGGSFDVLSGFKRRAPEWVRNLGLEWLYRTIQSPKEKWKVPLDIAKFSLYTLAEVLK